MKRAARLLWSSQTVRAKAPVPAAPSYTNYYGAFAGCTSLKEIEFPRAHHRNRPTTPSTNPPLRFPTASPSAPVSSAWSFLPRSPASDSARSRYPLCRNVMFTAGTSGAMAIEKYAFYRASIIKLVLPETVATIGDYAFQDNEDLVTVSLPVSPDFHRRKRIQPLRFAHLGHFCRERQAADHRHRRIQQRSSAYVGQSGKLHLHYGDRRQRIQVDGDLPKLSCLQASPPSERAHSPTVHP